MRTRTGSGSPALSMRCRLGGILLTGLAGGVLPPQDPSPFDLRVSIKRHQPTLVSLSWSAQGGFREPGAAALQTVNETRTVRYVDEFLVVDPDTNHYEVKRFYGQHHSTDQGSIRDLCLNGVQLLFRTENGQVQVDVTNGRRIPIRLLNDKLRESAGAGAWLDLPPAMSVGDRCSVDLTSHLYALSETHRTIANFQSEFTLDRVDPDTRLAYLSGNASWSERRADQQNALTWSLACQAQLKVDLRAEQVAELTLEGTAQLTSADPDPQSAERIRFQASLNATWGEAAAQASRTPPVIRSVKHEWKNLGVSLELPSTWAPSTPTTSPSLLSPRHRPTSSFTWSCWRWEVDP